MSLGCFSRGHVTHFLHFSDISASEPRSRAPLTHRNESRKRLHQKTRCLLYVMCVKHFESYPRPRVEIGMLNDGSKAEILHGTAKDKANKSLSVPTKERRIV